MAGKSEHISGMWASLRKHLDLEEPTRLIDNVYLGCGQKNITPPAKLVSDKALLYKTLFDDRLKPEFVEEPNDVAGAIRRVAPKLGKSQKRGPAHAGQWRRKPQRHVYHVH